MRYYLIAFFIATLSLASDSAADGFSTGASTNTIPGNLNVTGALTVWGTDSYAAQNVATQAEAVKAAFIAATPDQRNAITTAASSVVNPPIKIK